MGVVPAPTFSPNHALSGSLYDCDGLASSLSRAAGGLPSPPEGIS